MLYLNEQTIFVETEGLLVYDAFISYRRKNGFMAAKMIRELLKSKGVTAFMDLDELKSGTFDDKLLKAIEESPAFILVLPSDALSRCGEKDDWLTKEIVAAVNSGSNIIPVLGDGFEWPKEWDKNVPEQVKCLSSYNGVEMSQYYVDAMIDKIIERIRGRSAESGNSDIDTFFKNRMKDMGQIKGVDLAFHAGATWLESIDRVDLLEDLAESGVNVRIIINTPESAEILGKHMRHRLKRYTSFSEAIELWKGFCEPYENVRVKVSDIPLLRIYYSFHMANPESDAVRVKYYTYGNAKIDKNFARNFEFTDSCFKLYRTEFEFLWDKAEELQ